MDFREFFFIDFDGVICDSRDECFVVSLAAYEAFRGWEAGISIPLTLKRRFDELRPHIRDSADFLYLHYWLEKGENVLNQKHFDSCISLFSDQDRARFIDLFYGKRSELLKRERSWWFLLNTLYPGMEEALKIAAANPDIHILSSKRPDFIVKILGGYGISWPGERIHFPDGIPKMVYLRDFFKRYSQKNTCAGIKAKFLDDQIDHFLDYTHESVEPLLASWGYIIKDWLNQTAVRAISLDACLAMLSQPMPIAVINNSKFGAP